LQWLGKETDYFGSWNDVILVEVLSDVPDHTDDSSGGNPSHAQVEALLGPYEHE
jgi:hypothetical protein